MSCQMDTVFWIEIYKRFIGFPSFLVEIKYCRSRRKNPLFEAKLEKKGCSDDEMKMIKNSDFAFDIRFDTDDMMM